jgi:hypothetical protein
MINRLSIAGSKLGDVASFDSLQHLHLKPSSLI